jgi:hypothetical protein
VLSCGKLRGLTNERHDAVLEALRRCAREGGLLCRWKPSFKGPVGSKVEIPDLEIRNAGWSAVIDVSVVHSSAPSVAGRADSAVAGRSAAKSVKYDRSVVMSGASVKVPFIVESHGVTSPEAVALIDELAKRCTDYTLEDYYDVMHRYKDIIAISIQRGHARLVRRICQLAA